MAKCAKTWALFSKSGAKLRTSKKKGALKKARQPGQTIRKVCKV